MVKKKSSAKHRKTGSRTLRMLLWIALPSGLVGGLALGLGHWPMPTRVQVELTAKSLEVTAARDRPSFPLLNPAVGFKSLAVEGLQSASFSPQGLRFPGSAGMHPFEGRSLTLFGGGFPRARLSLETPGRLAALEIPAGTTVVVAAGTGLLRLKWPESPRTLEIFPANPVRLYAAHVHREFQDAPRDAELRLEAELRREAPLITLETLPGGALTLILPGAEPLDFLGGKALPVARIAFREQDDHGFPASTLAGKGKVRYPDYPKLSEREIEPRELLGIAPAEGALLTLTALRLDSGQGVLAVSLAGRVARLWSGRDYRLTLLDAIWNDTLAVLVFTLVAWAGPVSVGIYKLYREIAES